MEDEQFKNLQQSIGEATEHAQGERDLDTTKVESNSPASGVAGGYGAATREEPTPDGDGEDVARLVQADIEARAEEGERKYGERLTTGNGRNALVDAYQEALDLCMYLRQQIEEQAAP